MRKLREKFFELIGLFYNYYMLISLIVIGHFKIDIFLDLLVLKFKGLKIFLNSIRRNTWTLNEWFEYFLYKYSKKIKISQRYEQFKKFIQKFYYFIIAIFFVYLILKSNYEFYPSLHIYYFFTIHFWNNSSFIFLKTLCLITLCCFLLILPAYFGSEIYYKNIKNYNQFFWGTPQAKKTIKQFLMIRFYVTLLIVIVVIFLVIYIFL